MTTKTELIRRPAGNVVLEFKEIGSMKRTITLTSTDEEGVFELEKGLTALNQISHREIIKGVDAVKALWVDAVVNGFQLTKNEVFMRGVKDVLPPYRRHPDATTLQHFVDTPAPHKGSTMEISVPQQEHQGGTAPIFSELNL
jgi:hypothetical protein